MVLPAYAIRKSCFELQTKPEMATLNVSGTVSPAVSALNVTSPSIPSSCISKAFRIIVASVNSRYQTVPKGSLCACISVDQ